MKKKIAYTDEPIFPGRRLKDSLPPPHLLVFKEEGIKITLTLSKASVDYFKRAAKKHHTPYQKMIRNLIDAYAAAHPE